MERLTEWIDGFPVWAVVAASFVLGTAVGIALRIARRSKWQEKERQAAGA